MKLTKQELLLAIQCVSNTSVPVNQSQPLIQLSNKMSIMVDELQKKPKQKKK